MMFYKNGRGGLINLDEIVVIDYVDDRFYSLVFKGMERCPWLIDKEDYEGIIKYLEIVNEGDKQ